MTLCEDCAAIVPNQAGAPGHANLISLGEVRALHLARRRATHEVFTCAECGANWDYLKDKRDPTAGWTRCDRSTPAAAPSTDKGERAA